VSKKVLIIFGHHNYKTGTSFNAACRDAFMEECNKLGHEVDLINIYQEKQIKFWDGSPLDDQILGYRERMEAADVIFLLSPCHNFVMNSAMENFLSWTIGPPWAFTYKKIWANYGAPQPGKLKDKKIIIGMTYGSPSPILTFALHQMPRRIKKMVFKYLCGARVSYLRMYEVLPNMPKEKFEKHMETVRKTVRQL
jgi:NAD(P)H dehydrogenase (quinone)